MVSLKGVAVLWSTSDGRWSATWAAVNPRTSSLIVTATAALVSAGLSGTAQVGGTAQSNPSVPSLSANGMVSAGSYAPSAAPSPGELVSVFGGLLSNDVTSASTLPLPTLLAGTTLTLAGRKLPLVFT